MRKLCRYFDRIKKSYLSALSLFNPSAWASLDSAEPFAAAAAAWPSTAASAWHTAAAVALSWAAAGTASAASATSTASAGCRPGYPSRQVGPSGHQQGTAIASGWASTVASDTA